MAGIDAPLVVSIGTTHPWNIAGVGLDALVAAEYGVVHAMAIAAVSAQDAGGVRALHPIPADILTAQLHALPPGARAFRVGALVTAANIRAAAAFLKPRAAAVPVVVDPVLSATLGGGLHAGESALEALRAELLSLPVIVTPNIDETEALLGVRPESAGDLERCGERFVHGGARAALMKGGHLPGEPADALVTASESFIMSGTRYPGSMRGGGCTLAAALACELAQGHSIAAAARHARDYVREKIAAGIVRGGLQVAF